jgi:hypothetical protein
MRWIQTFVSQGTFAAPFIYFLKTADSIRTWLFAIVTNLDSQLHREMQPNPELDSRLAIWLSTDGSASHHSTRSRQYPGRRRPWATAIISKPALASRKMTRYGNLRSVILRVPNSCRGNCSGFSLIRSIARSRSSRNISAALPLRCPYHSVAASASSKAAG